MNKIIDGKALADQLAQKLKDKLNNLIKRPLVVSILIGSDPNSLLYTQMKQKKAEQFNIDFLPIKFSEDTPFETVAQKIVALNKTDEVKGIMIQLPIPKTFLGKYSKWDLINRIDPKKDIDGLVEGSPFMSATVKGVIKILDHAIPSASEGSVYQDLTFGVVGSKGEVGNPLIKELEKRGAREIIKIDKKNSESHLADLVKADIVISCTGVQGLINSEMVKDEVILIDVGLGDFDPEVYTKARMYTPKYGGVGPMTILALMENILEAVQEGKDII